MKFSALFAPALAVALLYAPPSDAGCGLTVTFENTTGSAITIIEVESAIVGAPYATVYTSDFSVPAHSSVSRAIELKTGCGPARLIRAKYRQGADEKFETKGPIATAVDRKITLTFK